MKWFFGSSLEWWVESGEIDEVQDKFQQARPLLVAAARLQYLFSVDVVRWMCFQVWQRPETRFRSLELVSHGSMAVCKACLAAVRFRLRSQQKDETWVPICLKFGKSFWAWKQPEKCCLGRKFCVLNCWDLESMLFVNDEDGWSMFSHDFAGKKTI